MKIAVIVVERPAMAARDAPKSISVGRPWSSTMMLAGLMSRCRKPMACTSSNPSSSGKISRSTASGVSRWSRIRRLLSVFALDQRHHHVGGAVGFEKVVHPDNGGRAVEPSQGACLVEEAFAAPRELLGMVGRERQHGGAALAQRQRRRQVLLDGDVPMERRSRAR